MKPRPAPTSATLALVVILAAGLYNVSPLGSHSIEYDRQGRFRDPTARGSRRVDSFEGTLIGVRDRFFVVLGRKASGARLVSYPGSLLPPRLTERGYNHLNPRDAYPRGSRIPHRFLDRFRARAIARVDLEIDPYDPLMSEPQARFVASTVCYSAWTRNGLTWHLSCERLRRGEGLRVLTHGADVYVATDDVARAAGWREAP